MLGILVVAVCFLFVVFVVSAFLLFVLFCCLRVFNINAPGLSQEALALRRCLSLFTSVAGLAGKPAKVTCWLVAPGSADASNAKGAITSHVGSQKTRRPKSTYKGGRFTGRRG